jgi:ribosome-associated translation inhibitor RaiA
MIRIVFKNLKSSDLLKDFVSHRITGLIDKFPDLRRHRMVITLSMYNSPAKRGPDLFGIKLHIIGSKFRNIILDKRAPNLYEAVATLSDSALERLNRFIDKDRVQKTRKQRRLKLEPLQG